MTTYNAYLYEVIPDTPILTGETVKTFSIISPPSVHVVDDINGSAWYVNNANNASMQIDGITVTGAARGGTMEFADGTSYTYSGLANQITAVFTVPQPDGSTKYFATFGNEALATDTWGGGIVTDAIEAMGEYPVKLIFDGSNHGVGTEDWDVSGLVDGSMTYSGSSLYYWQQNPLTNVELPFNRIVEGTDVGDLINGAYTGDPEGDLIDNNDGNPNSASGNDDSVLGFGGNDTILAGLGNDTIYGGGDTPDQFSVEMSIDPYWGLTYSTGSNIGDGSAGGSFHIADVDSDLLTPQSIRVFDGDQTLSTGEAIEIIFLDETGSEVIFQGTVQQSAFGGQSNVGSITAIGVDQFGNPMAVALGRGDGVQPVWPADTNYEDNDDVFTGAIGVDMVLSSTNMDNDNIDGGLGDDLIYGGLGNDTVVGGEGADFIDGGLGDDVLIVGAGDTVKGGAGDDLFVVDAALSGATTITLDGGETDEEAVVDPLNNVSGSIGDILSLKGLDNVTIVYNEADPTWDGITSESGTVTFTNSSGDPVTIEFSNIEKVVCFARGSLIRTADGDVAVQDLRQGDLVWTADRGYQPIRWIGKRAVSKATLAEHPNLSPIRIAPNALGHGVPQQELMVSPQHRILASSKIAQRMSGSSEVLVAAKHLTELPGVDVLKTCDGVEYWHLMFEQHELIEANGCLSESLYSGPEAIKSLSVEQKLELRALFPEIFDMVHSPVPARPLLNGRKGRKLAERLVKNSNHLVMLH